MQERIVLNKLPQELVNQIAAGEVIERPASVVKELIDNSIDANAKKVQIKIVNGGMDLIEVSDDGIGIPKENIGNVFDAHTTSKISSLEDLNNLLTMGFRGEALSTIVAVSKVKLISKYMQEEIANEIFFKDSGEKILRSAAREGGTVVTVENIFGNIPARRKFLKSALTEYKKILEILIPYFLVYPNIHFTLIKDSKIVYDLPAIQNSKPNSVEKERLNTLLKEEYVSRMLKVFFDGGGTRISGFVAHPSDHQKKASNQYIFVNRRPIKDMGISRAVYQGMSRYIPHGEKVSFVLLLDIKPDLVDVNVHPRKEEVRFLNPFRVYSAVEESVRKAVENATSYRIENRDFGVSTIPQSKVYAPRDISFGKSRGSSVQESLLFSKEALSQSSYESNTQIQNFSTQDVTPSSIRNIFQIFNKYIVIEFDEEVLWIVDQHAAAERITFEKLKKNQKVNLELQKLLVPFEIEMSEIEIIGMEELREFFTKIGFEYEIQDNKVYISSAPVEFIKTDFKRFFEEIFSLSDDIRNISKEILRLEEDIYATMACHGSVRSGQLLRREEMIDIYKKLIDCENPYSCPHGRPAVWKMKLSEIDMNFERTY
ncbi:hypothetical protein CVU76_02105 [Candidatus Dojkabacteria bacterium HGW-Dojkabacteria-1]|uniref:DNA mismatch repair protein MutL n=1 Tax=Candidatus Dojkabacteria bacterium HGW-Dojkabacteria-1 TaxID=2013761 RepID=A0A2N2F3P2_9BACT|nr:MAG: hypothetical protein CVU76_02105 [Candidatus Dojkabacteria bacterium HGW-Dojkabacteria-1]